MFRNSKISFDHLLQQSTCNILKHYGIKEGVLCSDDVDRARSKSTKKIYKVQKLKYKLTGGFLDGQCIVFLFLVTPVAFFPVGFESYPLIPQKVSVRGKEDIEIFISSARLYVPSHNAKRFVIAIQYPDEKKPR